MANGKSDLDSTTIRHLVFRAKKTGGGQGSTLTAFDIIEAVIDLAARDGLFPERPRVVRLQYDPLQDKILAVIWELVLESIYTPGSGTEHSSWPMLRATEYGQKCFEAGELTAHDPDDYLRRLKASCPSIDETTLLYTGEALDTFRIGKHLAATVMIGVAAENMLLRLVDEVHKALDTPQRQAKFEKDTKGKKAKTQHDEVLARLKSPSTPLPPGIESVLTQQIDGI